MVSSKPGAIQTGQRHHLTSISNGVGSGGGLAAAKFIERLFGAFVGLLKKHDRFFWKMAIGDTCIMAAKT